MRSLRHALTAFAAVSALLAALPTAAFAQDPPRPATPTAVAPLPPPLPAQPPAPAPAQQQPLPAPSGYEGAEGPVTIAPNCVLAGHAGVVEAEARTAAEIVCYELARQRAAGTPHAVRFGVLGGRTLVVVEARSAGADGSIADERRTFLAGMDEISVAAPRLVAALVDGKPLDETRNVDNVLASEAATPKSRRGQMGFDGGIFGATALGTSTGASAGVGIGLLYRAGDLGIGAQGRLGGIGSSDSKLTVASLDFGARYYLSSGDVTPFVGGGFAISSVTVVRGQYSDTALSGSGFGAYAMVGAELLRTHHAAVSAALRADAPFYALQNYGGDSSPGNVVLRSQYLVPLSFNVNFIFH